MKGKTKESKGSLVGLNIMFVVAVVSSNVFGEETFPTYLCVGEKAASITINDQGEISATSGVLESNFIVSGDKGLKRLGQDEAKLDHCYYNENKRPHFCTRSGHVYGGTFLMDDQNVFAISSLSLGGENNAKQYLWGAGHCSKL